MDKIISLADLKPDPKNARRHTPRNLAQIEASLRQVGAARSGVINADNVILAGNGTWEALASAGIERVKIVEADGNEWVVVQRKGLTEEQERILSVSDNSSSDLATWHGPTLEEQGIDLQPWFTTEELSNITSRLNEVPLGEREEILQETHKSLAERFVVPPFSVLDARQGYWQERKRAWLALGIQSELGRGNNNLTMSHPATTATIDFYSQKRQLEAELGHEISTDETKEHLAKQGALKDDRTANRQRKDAHQ